MENNLVKGFFVWDETINKFPFKQYEEIDNDENILYLEKIPSLKGFKFGCEHNTIRVFLAVGYNVKVEDDDFYVCEKMIILNELDDISLIPLYLSIGNGLFNDLSRFSEKIINLDKDVCICGSNTFITANVDSHITCGDCCVIRSSENLTINGRDSIYVVTKNELYGNVGRDSYVKCGDNSNIIVGCGSSVILGKNSYALVKVSDLSLNDCVVTAGEGTIITLLKVNECGGIISSTNFLFNNIQLEADKEYRFNMLS